MTRTRARKEVVPAERAETLRQRIRALLAGPPLSLKDNSGEVRTWEKDVLGHLEHLERSLHSQDCALVVEPAECGRCGFRIRQAGAVEEARALPGMPRGGKWE